MEKEGDKGAKISLQAKGEIVAVDPAKAAPVEGKAAVRVQASVEIKKV